MSLVDYQRLLSIVGSSGSMQALASGGWWHWNILPRQRSGDLPAKIEHVVTHKKVFYRKTLLTVEVSISNVSDVAVILRSSRTYVRQRSAMPEHFPPDMQNSSMPSANEASEGNMVAFQAEDWGSEGMILETGANRHFSYTFFIEDNIQKVSISTRVLAAERSIMHWFRLPRSTSGWSLTTFYDCAAPLGQSRTMKTNMFDNEPRIKLAVARYTSTFPRGILVEINNCTPDEPLEVLLYADAKQTHAFSIAANQSGQAYISLLWEANAHGQVVVRSKVTNETSEMRF